MVEKEYGFWNQANQCANSSLTASIYSPVNGDNKTYHTGMLCGSGIMYAKCLPHVQ